MPVPSAARFVGVAKEATKGTGVAPTAFIPMVTFDPEDHITYLDDDGMRGASAGPYNTIPGPTWATFGLGGDAFPDTFPWFLASLLGDLVTVGASAPFTHTIAVKNSTDMQPRGMTFTDYYGLSGTHSRQFAGAQVPELTLKFNADGKLEWSGSATSFASTLVAKPTQAFGAIPPVPSWVGTTTVGGGTILNCQVGELSVKRPLSVINSVDGTQSPYALFVGKPKWSGKMTIIMEDDTELLRFLTNTQPSLAFDWTQGAAAALTEIKATMAKVAYKTGAIKQGNDYLTTEVTFDAIANATDVGASAGFGSGRFVCQNAIAASIYV